MIDTKTILENKTDGYLTEDKQVKGGWLTVQTLEERDALLPAALKNGSLCYCTADSKFYIYDGSTWSEKQMGGGGGPASEVGDIIASKTLDTMEKVIASYGGTVWDSLGDEDGVYQWLRTDTYPPEYYLHFEAEEPDATIAYRIVDSLPNIHIQKSNDGIAWEDWDGTAITLTNIGDKVYVRNTQNTLSTGSYTYFNFVITGPKVKAVSTVNSMINFSPLTDYCYRMMFYGCTSLTQAPALPAMELTSNCYSSMFSGCSGLVQAPALPATQLATNCYQGMFENCSSLTIPPELPVATTAYGCYSYMFYNCRELKVSQDTGGTKFFTGPADTSCGVSMFERTGGSYTYSPVEGHDYYYN